MTQDIGDFLEGAAVLDQSTGQRVTQYVRTRFGQTTLSTGTADHLLDRIRREPDITQVASANEDRWARGRRTLVLHVGCQRLSGGLR
jgi:hypothetical protein